MGYSEFNEIEVNSVMGLEQEKADRDVGIMGDEFMLAIEDSEGKPTNIYFSEDDFMDLLELLKPHYEELRASEEFDRDMYDNHLEELKNGG